MAGHVIEEVLEKVDLAIFLEESKKDMIPNAVTLSIDQQGVAQGVNVLVPDARLDDVLIEEEMVEVEEPPPTRLRVYPWETNQIRGCWDFIPPECDIHITLDKLSCRKLPDEQIE